jgi:hypothetical protein
MFVGYTARSKDSLRLEVAAESVQTRMEPGIKGIYELQKASPLRQDKESRLYVRGPCARLVLNRLQETLAPLTVAMEG